MDNKPTTSSLSLSSHQENNATQFDNIGLEEEDNNNIAELEDSNDYYSSHNQQRFNNANLVINSINCDNVRVGGNGGDLRRGERSNIDIDTQDDGDGDNDNEDCYRTPFSTMQIAKPISSSTPQRRLEPEYPFYRSYSDQSSSSQAIESIGSNSGTRSWLRNFVTRKYYNFNFESVVDHGVDQAGDNNTTNATTFTNVQSVVDDQWSRNYLEAAIYLEEGINNDKFDYHPQTCQELPAYLLAHNRLYHWIDLIACLLILALALFEKPAVDGIRLPESTHALMELFGLFIIGLMLAIKFYWLGARYCLHHWRTAIKTLVLGLMIVEASVVLVRQDSHIRITRSLRPVFLIDNHFLGGVRRLIRQTIQSLRSFVDMLLLLLFFLIFFSISGFYLMADIDNNEYFSSIWNSFLSLFVLLTTSNFPDVMMPAYRDSQLYALFFIVFLMINLYFFLNIMLAVVYLAFSSIEKEKFRKLYLHRRKACDLAFRLLVPNGRQSNDHIDFKHFVGMFNYLRPNQNQLELFLIFKALTNYREEQSLNSKLLASENMDRKKILVRDGELETSGMIHDEEQQLTLDKFYHIYDVLDLQWKMCGETIPWFAKLRCDCLRSTLYKLRSIITHRFFDYFIYSIIVCAAIYQLLNAIYGGYEKWQQQIGLSTSAAAICVMFIILYSVEMFVKLLVLGPREYFRVGWNCFDALITSIALIALILSQYLTLLSVSTSLFSLRSLRLLDLLRANVTRYRDILGPFAFVIIRRFISVTMVVLIVYYFFAIIAMECFGGYSLVDCCNGTNVEVYFRSNGTSNFYYYLNNFDDIVTSYITLFELMVVNNWQVLMSGYVQVTGTRMTTLFFIVFYIISLVVITIVIAFVLDTFQFHIQYRNRFGDDNLSVKITTQVCISKSEFERFSSATNLTSSGTTTSVGGGGMFGFCSRLKSICNCFGGVQRFDRLDSIRSVPDPGANIVDIGPITSEPLSVAAGSSSGQHRHYYHHRSDCQWAHLNSLHSSMPPSTSSPCLPYHGTKIRDKFSYNQQMYSDEIDNWKSFNNSHST